MDDQELREIRQQRLRNVEERTNDIFTGKTMRGAQHLQRVRDVVPYINVAYGEDDDPIFYSPLRCFLGLSDPTTITRITIKLFTVIATSDVETLSHRERNVTLVDEDQREWAIPDHVPPKEGEDVLEHRLVRLNCAGPEAKAGFIYEYEKLTYFLDCLHDILEDQFGVLKHDWRPESPVPEAQREAWIAFYKRVHEEYKHLTGKEIENLGVVINGQRRTRHFV